MKPCKRRITLQQAQDYHQWTYRWWYLRKLKTHFINRITQVRYWRMGDRRLDGKDTHT